MKNIVLLLAICSFVLTSCRKKDGYFELSSIINDNMVIQQNSTIKFWGKASPGVVVNVAPTWAEKRSVVAGADSIWETEYATPAADHQCHEVHIYNKIRRLMVANVVFGEVWLAVGQGNLALSLKKDFADRHYADTALTSSDEFLRFYNIDTNFIKPISANEPSDVYIETSDDFCRNNTGCDSSKSGYEFGYSSIPKI